MTDSWCICLIHLCKVVFLNFAPPPAANSHFNHWASVSIYTVFTNYWSTSASRDVVRILIAEGLKPTRSASPNGRLRPKGLKAGVGFLGEGTASFLTLATKLGDRCTMYPSGVRAQPRMSNGFLIIFKVLNGLNSAWGLTFNLGWLTHPHKPMPGDVPVRQPSITTINVPLVIHMVSKLQTTITVQISSIARDKSVVHQQGPNGRLRPKVLKAGVRFLGREELASSNFLTQG